MRHLAWLLLLANLGMFAWLLTQPQPQPLRYRVAPVPPGVEPLVLLSERPTAAPSAAAGVDTESAPETETPPGDTQAVASAASVEPAAGQAAPADADAGAANDVDAASQPPAAPQPVCQAVGPFLEQPVAEAVGSRLADLGYQPNMRTAEVRNPAGYWVYLPAMPAEQARRIVAELDARGISDYYIGKQNYVSLGIYSGRQKAQARLDQIKGLGYEAVLDQRFRTRTAYWIDIVQGAEPLLATPAWKDILSQHADIRVQRISCE